MSNWIKSDFYRFDRVKTFFVSRKHMLMERELFSFLDEFDRPEAMEQAVRELLLHFRPELAGCVIWAMGYEHSYGMWQFTVSHASLPVVSPLDSPPRVPLDPALEPEFSSPSYA